MQEFQQAKTVALYYSIGDEVATGPLLRLCLGKQICLPAVTGPGEMEFRMFRQDRMTIGPLAKIPEPDSTCPAVPVEAIDFFVVPGLGFDGERRLESATAADFTTGFWRIYSRTRRYVPWLLRSR